MPRLTQRLNRLEKAFRASGGGVCRLCYGTPIAAILIEYEDSPDRPGFHPTGRRYLDTTSEDRVTDELRCRRCGAQAKQTHLMTLVDIDPPPKGRRICAA
jgi:hypothetical protein